MQIMNSAEVGTNGRALTAVLLLIQNSINYLKKKDILCTRKPFKSKKIAPFVFIADEAFQLQGNLTKPYSWHNLNGNKNIFKYTHGQDIWLRVLLVF
jgi:hypothetical protein